MLVIRVRFIEWILRTDTLQIDEGGLTVYVLLSLVNKETALAFDRTAAQIGGVDRTECWEEEGSEAVTMNLLPEMDIGQTLASKLQLHGDTQI